MVRNIQEAIAELKIHPETPVETALGGIVVEMRFKRRRTAADLFEEIGPWEGESFEEITRILSEARKAGGSGEAPKF